MGSYKVLKRRSIAGVMRNVGEVVEMPKAYADRFMQDGSIAPLQSAEPVKESPAKSTKASEESK